MKHPDKILRRYYIGIALIVCVLSVVSVAIIVGGWDERTDRLVAKKLYETSNAVRSYSDSNSKLPASLNQLKIKSNDISYERLTPYVYMLCANFKTKFDNAYGGRKLDSNLMSQQAQQEYERLKDQDDSTNYILVEQYDFYSINHDLGRNCYITERQNTQNNYYPTSNSPKNI